MRALGVFCGVAFGGAIVGCSAILGVSDYRDCQGAECGDAAFVGDSGADRFDADARADIVDAPTGWCASRPKPSTFCDDFDEGAFFTPFEKVMLSSAGTLNLDPTFWQSPPNSLASNVPQKSSNGDFAYVVKEFAGTASHVVLAFDFQPASAPGDKTGAVVASINATNGTTTHGFGYRINPPEFDSVVETLEGVDASASVTHSVTWLSAVNEWQRIQIDVDLVKRSYGVTINGVARGSDSMMVSWPTSAAISISIGVQGIVAQQLTGWGVRFDNLTVDVK